MNLYLIALNSIKLFNSWDRTLHLELVNSIDVLILSFFRNIKPIYFYSRFARILYTDRIEHTSIEFTRKLDLAGNW